MIDRPWLLGGASAWLRRKSLSICSPQSLGQTWGSSHLSFTETAVRLCPPTGTRQAQVNCHPKVFPLNGL